MKLNRFFLFLFGILLTYFSAGCIESDETRSFYVSPDGKVDILIYQDKVHSSDKEKGPKELEDWFKNFKAHKSSELKELKETGARHLKSILLREKPPYAAIISASYDSVEAFGRFLDLNKPEGGGTLTFEQEGKTRRIVFRTEENIKRITKKISAQDPSLYYPIWKFITLNGKISRADGFIISEDRRSCLLNLPGLERMKMKKTPQGYEFSIVWNVE